MFLSVNSIAAILIIGIGVFCWFKMASWRTRNSLVALSASVATYLTFIHFADLPGITLESRAVVFHGVYFAIGPLLLSLGAFSAVLLSNVRNRWWFWGLQAWAATVGLICWGTGLVVTGATASGPVFGPWRLLFLGTGATYLALWGFLLVRGWLQEKERVRRYSIGGSSISLLMSGVIILYTNVYLPQIHHDSSLSKYGAGIASLFWVFSSALVIYFARSFVVFTEVSGIVEESEAGSGRGALEFSAADMATIDLLRGVRRIATGEKAHVQFEFAPDMKIDLSRADLRVASLSDGLTDGMLETIKSLRSENQRLLERSLAYEKQQIEETAPTIVAQLPAVAQALAIESVLNRSIVRLVDETFGPADVADAVEWARHERRS